MVERRIVLREEEGREEEGREEEKEKGEKTMKMSGEVEEEMADCVVPRI